MWSMVACVRLQGEQLMFHCIEGCVQKWPKLALGKFWATPFVIAMIMTDVDLCYSGQIFSPNLRPCKKVIKNVHLEFSESEILEYSLQQENYESHNSTTISIWAFAIMLSFLLQSQIVMKYLLFELRSLKLIKKLGNVATTVFHLFSHSLFCNQF